MHAAIIGLPQSGKSTVFSAVTEQALDAHAPLEPRRAIAKVPDSRLGYLTDLCRPKKVVWETIEFVDLPGCSLDTPHGQADWRRLLPHVRQAEVLVIVVRAFADASIPSYKDRVDPQADLLAVWEELLFADLEAVSNRIERLEKALKKPAGSHEAHKSELGLLQRCHDALEVDAPLSTVVTTDEERRMVSGFSFVTQRPIVCVNNISDDQIDAVAPLQLQHLEAQLSLRASIEAEVAQLDAEDRAAFLEDLGVAEPARDLLIHACYKACGLISFLTMGPDECRAWALRAGGTALDAARVIHTDLARGFIRAETVAFDDLVAHKDVKGARAAGRMRKEGKAYIVQDGDSLNILHSC